MTEDQQKLLLNHINVLKMLDEDLSTEKRGLLLDELTVAINDIPLGLPRTRRTSPKQPELHA